MPRGEKAEINFGYRRALEIAIELLRNPYSSGPARKTREFAACELEKLLASFRKGQRTWDAKRRAKKEAS
jgi:hypothetical protein